MLPLRSTLLDRLDDQMTFCWPFVLQSTPPKFGFDL